ncbi:acyltransferase [Occultella glacieicola]|uniref:Acyltransferase n=1 Tax=Occultella glacieicola TaxID=2518684 RepID=A0ABY2E9C2_9MICO|nr:acyltransferase family protein [Occultella glacieicola]TDE97587.1 acyltransferase [Occultella glacieicola]
MSVDAPSAQGRAQADSPDPGDPAQALRTGRIDGLDGVRALAIIAVLIFHLRPLSLPGGYLGVDVFFVISGFLITTLLVRELRADRRVDLRRFWTRRARRLLPALVVVVFATVSLALIAGEDLLVNIGRQVLGALTFSNNWLEIGAGSSYFNATAPQLFVNFWSLAVEEQFYLFWPLLFLVMMGITRTGRQRVGLLLALATASAVAMAVLYTPGQDATRVYYGTDTHAFGLMIGAALAVSAAGESANLLATRFWRRGRVVIALAALAGLIALMLWLDPDNPIAYRGGIVAAALLTAAIVGALPGPRTVLTVVFSLRPLAWIGERSYGIYLWHWPVILLIAAITPRVGVDTAGHWVQRALAVLVTLLIAGACYRWIENPIRELGFAEATRRALDAIGAPGRLTLPRVGVVASLACVSMFTAALATAPDRSQVEIAMADAATVVEDAGAADDGAVVDPAADAGPTAAGGSAADGTDTGGAEAPADEPAPSGGAPTETAPTESAPTETAPTEDPTQPAGVTGEQITAFGDSMLYVAAPGLTADLPGIGIDAKSNRQWPDVLAAIQAAVEAGTVREYVVIAAGTNAGVRDPDLVRQALDLLGPDRSVVLVNIYGSSTWVPESNQNLADLAAEYPNVAVADWNAAATAHPEQLQPDLIHPNMDGMYLFSDVVRAALATLTD